MMGDRGVKRSVRDGQQSNWMPKAMLTPPSHSDQSISGEWRVMGDE